jgi:hypothetical protein
MQFVGREAEKTVIRLVSFLEEKLKLFGPEPLTRELRLRCRISIRMTWRY